MLILLFFFLLSIYYYFQDNKSAVLFCLTAIVTNSFGFVDPEGMSIKSTDVVLVFVFFTLIAGYFKNKSFFNVKNDPFALIILIIVAYLLLNLIGTVALRIESPMNALKVVRPFFAYLLYFYVRTLKKKDFLNYVKLVFIASVIQGVFYYLQLFDINVLSGRVDEAEATGEITRYANYPAMASFFVLYYVVLQKISFARKLFIIVFWGMMLILGQMRGVVIALAATLGLFFFLKRKLKYVGYIAIGAIVYQFVVAPMFEYRTRNKISTMTEIKNVVSDPTNIFTRHSNESSSGNFSFRIAMLAERIIYISHHPQFIPFGVGCIHEESAANNFVFQLGTSNDNYRFGIGMLSSADIAWVGLLMHYGLLGVSLYLLLFYLWARAGLPYVRKSNDSLLITASLMVVSSFLLSFDSDNTSRTQAIMITIFYLAVIYRYNHDRKVALFLRNYYKSPEERAEVPA